ncbi:MAG: hypothetical protein J6W96_02150 [Alphaproteobacteria bacterium]|nr:hypothetical protein [Alphaproteobacteria bacterium]
MDINQNSLSPWEQLFLEKNYNEAIAYAILRAENAGWCMLSDAFVAELYERGNEEIKTFLLEHPERVKGLVLDKIFEKKDVTFLKGYLSKIHSFYMEPQHIIEMIELGDKELIDNFFKIFAPFVFQVVSYNDVVNYLKEQGLYSKYRKKYLPSRFGK